MTRSTFVVVPGAWMGAWLWEDMVERPRGVGHEPQTLTLSCLAPRTSLAEVAAVGLEDHVADVLALPARTPAEPVVVVGHSYSAVVVAQIAGRVPERVARVLQVAAILPRDGRSLPDDWSPDP